MSDGSPPPSLPTNAKSAKHSTQRRRRRGHRHGLKVSEESPPPSLPATTEGAERSTPRKFDLSALHRLQFYKKKDEWKLTRDQDILDGKCMTDHKPEINADDATKSLIYIDLMKQYNEENHSDDKVLPSNNNTSKDKETSVITIGQAFQEFCKILNRISNEASPKPKEESKDPDDVLVKQRKLPIYAKISREEMLVAKIIETQNFIEKKIKREIKQAEKNLQNLQTNVKHIKHDDAEMLACERIKERNKIYITLNIYDILLTDLIEAENIMEKKIKEKFEKDYQKDQIVEEIADWLAELLITLQGFEKDEKEENIYEYDFRDKVQMWSSGQDERCAGLQDKLNLSRFEDEKEENIYKYDFRDKVQMGYLGQDERNAGPQNELNLSRFQNLTLNESFNDRRNFEIRQSDPTFEKLISDRRNYEYPPRTRAVDNQQGLLVPTSSYDHQKFRSSTPLNAQGPPNFTPDVQCSFNTSITSSLFPQRATQVLSNEPTSYFGPKRQGYSLNTEVPPFDPSRPPPNITSHYERLPNSSSMPLFEPRSPSNSRFASAYNRGNEPQSFFSQDVCYHRSCNPSPVSVDHQTRRHSVIPAPFHDICSGLPGVSHTRPFDLCQKPPSLESSPAPGFQYGSTSFIHKGPHMRGDHIPSNVGRGRGRWE